MADNKEVVPTLKTVFSLDVTKYYILPEKTTPWEEIFQLSFSVCIQGDNFSLLNERQ